MAKSKITKIVKIRAPAGKKKKSTRKPRARKQRSQPNSVKGNLPAAFTTTMARSKPKFRNRSSDSVSISHTEMFAEFSTTEAYSPTAYTVGISNSSVFPWASNMSKNYQNYRFNSLAFHFVPSVGTGVNGNIDLAMVYDASSPTPLNTLALLSNEDSASSQLFRPLTLRATPKNLHQVKELWVVGQGEGYDQGGAVRLNWLGNLYVSPTSDTVVTAGRMYVSYDVTLSNPVPSVGAGQESGMAYFANGGAFTHDVTLPSPGELEFENGSLKFTNLNLPNNQADGQSAIIVTSPADLRIDLDIGTEGISAAINEGIQFGLTTLFTIYEVISGTYTLISSLPAAYSKFYDGYQSFQAGISILASAFTGTGPWGVAVEGNWTAATPAQIAALTTLSYNGAFVAVEFNNPEAADPFTAIGAYDEKQQALIDAGFGNGSYRISIHAETDVSKTDVFGSDPILQLSGTSVDLSVNNVVTCDLAPGPYLINVALVGTVISASSVTCSTGTVDLRMAVINAAATNALCLYEVYSTGGPTDFTLANTSTTVIQTEFDVSPTAEFVFVVDKPLVTTLDKRGRPKILQYEDIEDVFRPTTPRITPRGNKVVEIPRLNVSGLIKRNPPRRG